MKGHSCETTSPPSKLAIHNDSHRISKQKPKIRIIHIVAPEIIKTDVQNFRELVQRLTGKPLERKGRMKKVNNISSQVLQPKTYGSNARKNTQSTGISVLQNTQRMKRESEEIHAGENPNAILSFLGEVDGFIHDMNGFPLLPFRSSQINTFTQMPLC